VRSFLSSGMKPTKTEFQDGDKSSTHWSTKGKGEEVAPALFRSHRKS
jgi:hypothetical protein